MEARLTVSTSPPRYSEAWISDVEAYCKRGGGGRGEGRGGGAGRLVPKVESKISA